MDRRDILKSLLIGTGGIAGGVTLKGCTTGVSDPETYIGDYGRTESERKRDLEILSQEFLTENELTSIAILCDIILPAGEGYVSATDASAQLFIEFIVKDIEDLKLPLRGGLMWLDIESNSRYNKFFRDLTDEEQINIIDDIANPETAGDEFTHGVKFFSLLRFLTLTAFYTSKSGIEELGYAGNVPNVWDGVPEHVLRKHGLTYEEDWLSKCVDQSRRNEIAKWDEEGNLLT